MIEKQYDIIIDNKKIGTTELENADAPMGVVLGKINFSSIISGYDFFKAYCLTNNIEIAADDRKEKLLVTRFILHHGVKPDEM